MWGTPGMYTMGDTSAYRGGQGIMTWHDLLLLSRPFSDWNQWPPLDGSGRVWWGLAGPTGIWQVWEGLVLSGAVRWSKVVQCKVSLG